MDRRAFLRLTGGSAAAAALGAWLLPGCARGPLAAPQDPRFVPAPPQAGLGKPLLVVVAPKDESEGYQRGHAIGPMLNHGGDDLLAALALVDVACVGQDDLPPSALEGTQGLPWFVLLTRRDGALVPRALTPVLPELVNEGSLWEEAKMAKYEASLRARTDALTAALRGLIAPDGAALDALAESARRALPPEESAALTAMLERGETPSLEQAERGAALVAAAASRVPQRKAEWTAVLAAGARARYVDRRIRGCHWAEDSSCGADKIEGVPPTEMELSVACGMGMVPEVSRRFLAFYVRR